MSRSGTTASNEELPMGLATGCDPDIAALNLAGMS
ncbi:hypothetical protein JMJ76_0012817 [Colletotrichum scovillei]|nr:hypothetical protein JMJ78_0005784 [Colletotrichum scovillei]KAG7065065.1 hypothetical protein JMJ76_0012817 [Colletotrichum scovillei]